MIGSENPAKKYADLHVHTYFSDGTFSPEEVVKCALERGLACIAICDHDCIDGIEPAIESAKNTSLEIVPAVELTALKDGREIHMLAYFIAWREKWFRELLQKIQTGRLQRLDEMLKKLAECNIKVDKEKVLELSPHGSVGRLHLAKVMFQSKAVSSIQAAFDKYIGDFKPCYVEDVGLELKEALAVIKRAGGVSVLAHPSTLNNDRLVQDIIGYGVRGMEIFHTDHTGQTSRKYEKMAKDHNLLITGGSDCHGMGKGRILMGGVKVPYSFVEKLKKAAG